MQQTDIYQRVGLPRQPYGTCVCTERHSILSDSGASALCGTDNGMLSQGARGAAWVAVNNRTQQAFTGCML